MTRKELGFRYCHTSCQKKGRFIVGELGEEGSGGGAKPVARLPGGEGEKWGGLESSLSDLRRKFA